MNEIIIQANRRKLILQNVVQTHLPNNYTKIFEKLKFSNLERTLATGILKIELTVRPSYLRLPEILLASFNILFSSFMGFKLRNYTIGPFQIGVLTSLRWTRSNINLINYLQRVLLLTSAKDSSRIFRIGVHKFLKFYNNHSDKLVDNFAEFYNGKQTQRHKISYGEVLSFLVKKNISENDLKKRQKPINRIVQINISKNSIFDNIDKQIELRLKKIKENVVDNNKLCSVIILCSKTKRKVVYSKIYGLHSNPIPVLNTGRLVGSTIKVALYSAFLERFNIPLTTIFYDQPISIKWRGGLLSPRNADGKFRGEVTLEYAFANSINTIALQLIQKLGITNFINYLRKCGIACPLPNTPLLSLGPIRLTGWDIIATLSPVLNNGYLVWPTGITNYHYLPYNNGEKIINAHTAKK